MEAKKALIQEFFPNHQNSDSDLKLLLDSLKKAYPKKSTKEVLKEMQQDQVLWNNFKAKYPHANIRKFHLESTSSGGKVTRNIYYGDHWAWGESKHDPSAFSSAEIAALGRASTFPRQLTLTSNKYPVPGIKFSESVDDIASELITLNIYVTPTQSFQAKMRNIFTKTVVPFWSSKQAY